MISKPVSHKRLSFRGVIHRPHAKYYTFAEKEPFVLESGAKLGPITVAYETYGTLSPTKDNVILIPHALTGDAHCASHGPDDEPGWWEGFVGSGLAIDTDRYFVICSNVLGGCQGTTGPSEMDPRTGRPYGMRFPIVTIGDMVRVQRELMGFLGIERLHAVIGGSMGGMQALEWALAYPDVVGSLIFIAAPGSSSPQTIAYNEIARLAITGDPEWRGGDYYDSEGPAAGLGIARMIGMITYQSDESMWTKFGRGLMHASSLYDFSTRFEVESYLDYQGKKFVDRFDANTYLYLMRALDLFDVGRGRGGIHSALARLKARTLIIGISSDILYPVEQQKELVEILHQVGRQAEYAEIKSSYGHDAFLVEADRLKPMLSSFLLDS